MSDKAVITCALTGVLTDPSMANLPVTPEEMAEAAQQAWDQGATIVHCHFRDQRPGKGMFPTWDPEVVKEVIGAVRDRVPGIIINQTTGVIGPDISAPVACLEATKPEMAACNAGTLNYLKQKKDGSWAWPPIAFDNRWKRSRPFWTR